MHDLQKWSEDEVSIKKKEKTSQKMPKKLQNSPTSQNEQVQVLNL